MVNKISLEQFLKQVGRGRFQAAIGKSPQLVTRAKSEGVMPAHWFFETRDWCIANQIDVPEHLFKGGNRSTTKQNANLNARIQGQPVQKDSASLENHTPGGAE